MGANSFAENPMFHMNMAQAEEFMEKYKNALPTLFQWEERLMARGRREGTVYTYFGRPRRIKGYFDNRQFAFANRTIVNTTVQGCLLFNSLVLTNKGYVKLGKLYNEFQGIGQDMEKWDYKVWNGFKWCDFFPVYRGKDVRYEIHFSNGYIHECDSRHKIRVFNDIGTEWQDVKSMAVGEQVCFSRLQKRYDCGVHPKSILGRGTTRKSKNKKAYSDILFEGNDIRMLAYLYGYMLGDGGLNLYTTESGGSTRYTLSFGKPKFDNAEFICKYLNSKGITSNIKKKSNHVSRSGKISEVWSIDIACTPLVNAIIELTGCEPNKNVYTKRLGEKVFTFDRDLVGCVLKGLQDTDGSQSDGCLHMCNEVLLRDIQKLLRYYGYSSHLFKNGIKSANIKNDKDWKLDVHNCREYLSEINSIDLLSEQSSYNTNSYGWYKIPTNSYFNSVITELAPKASRKYLTDSEYVVVNRVKNGGRCEVSTCRKLIQKICENTNTSKLVEDYDYYEVEKVVPTNEEVDTYTLCVLDDSHQYDSEGVISHNTASDMLKIVMCKLWGNVLNSPKYKDDVAFRVTIHDEIGYSIRANVMNTLGKLVQDTMTIKLENWPVLIETEASFGFRMGQVWAFAYDEKEQTYKPKLD